LTFHTVPLEVFISLLHYQYQLGTTLPYNIVAEYTIIFCSNHFNDILENCIFGIRNLNSFGVQDDMKKTSLVPQDSDHENFPSIFALYSFGRWTGFGIS
jgi:hypothetical protein